jgi:hypothetical protein
MMEGAELDLWFTGGMSALAQDRRLIIRFAIGPAVFTVLRGDAPASGVSAFLGVVGHVKILLAG